MNWDAAVQGALVGTYIGAATGLIPLGVGYLCREKRKAIAGFLGCILGGAVGGLYAAIAVMSVSTAQIVQPQRQAGERTTEWTGITTAADKLWFVAAMSWLFFCMFGTMFISAAFLTPLVLCELNWAPGDSIEKIIVLLMLFGGLGLGTVFGFIGASFISRRFISSATHSNWVKDFEASTMNRSRFLRKVARYYYGFLLPREFWGHNT